MNKPQFEYKENTYDSAPFSTTDTAFYRNKAYHQQADTADSLDYERMAKVVVAVFEATKSI